MKRIIDLEKLYTRLEKIERFDNYEKEWIKELIEEVIE